MRFRTVLLLASLLAWYTSPAAAEGDPRGERNLADSSDLPQGKGFAADFPGDRDLAEHAAVIFAEDFETEGYRDRWDSVRDKDAAVLSLVETASGDAKLGRRALRVTARLEENTGGGLTQWFPSAERIFIRFYTRFAPDCDYVHHFVTLRANQALRGRVAWSGFGGAGERPEGDERFSTALEPWGNRGRWQPPGRWNFYSYWHEMSASPDGRYWGDAFRPAEQPPIPRGQWICAEFMLKHNTPGEADGEQAFWINGQLRGHWRGINWRKSDQLWANAFTLESYVTDRWTDQRVNVVDFDNVVIAREYIGP